LDELVNKPANATLLTRGVSGNQISTPKDPPAVVEGIPSNQSLVKNGLKECNTCHETKALSQFRKSEGHGIPALPNTRNAYCIPCEDIKRRALTERSSHTISGHGTISDGSNGKRVEPSSQAGQPPREGPSHIGGRFTAKRGGGRGLSHTQNASSRSRKSLDVISQKRTTPSEFINNNDEDEPLARRRKTSHVTSGNNITTPISQNATPGTQNTSASAKTSESSQAGEKPTQPKPLVVRSRRYLKALAEVEMCSGQEQELELADLKFRTSVLGNVIEKVTPESRTSRYQKAEAEMAEMSPEEQQLELASLRFQLSVVQDVIENRKE